jgi:hypothetical protein
MSAIVDFTYYYNVYMGQEADQASFPALCARAEDVVGAMTRWVNFENLSVFQQTLYKKAICAQVDYFAVNGLDSVAGGNDGRGWTVGKVSVNNGRYMGVNEKTGSMSAHISPLVIMYLEQSGLMNPQVETIPQMPVLGGWL